MIMMWFMIDDEIGQQLVKLASKNVLSYLSEEKKETWSEEERGRTNGD